MTQRLTKKYVRANYDTILCVGYCDLQHLFNCSNPIGYSDRVEGWACDYYYIGNGTVVSTGYAPIGRKVNFEIVKRYDEQAREICNETSDYETRRELLDTLIEEFRKEVA